MFKSPAVDGIRYLLVTEAGHADFVLRYTTGEIGELFTVDQLNALADGKTIDGRGGTRITDMVVAARAELVA